MKILHYLLGASLLFSGIDLIFTITGNLYACPRCRRALPKGPRKLPHPNFPGRHERPANSPPLSVNNRKEPTVKESNCRQCCCCIQQKQEERLNEQE